MVSIKYPLMTLSGTGHRPNKLGGYGTPAFEELVALASWYLRTHPADVVISGMALGWDQALAVAALRIGIPVHAFVPCEGHSSNWPDESQRYYAKILKRCAVVSIAPVPYTPAAMMKRNKDMVDSSDVVLALWDGSAGGTGNCVRYARKAGKPIVNLWDIYTMV